MTTILIFLALVCAVVATAMGFGWFGLVADDIFGWGFAALALYLLSHLAGPLAARYDRRT